MDTPEISTRPWRNFARQSAINRTRALAQISEVVRRMTAYCKQRHLKGYFVKTMSIKASLIAGAMLMSIGAQAQNSSSSSSGISPQKSEAFQALCRVKAKESANVAFKSCMNENKSAEIENIRKGYQERLEQIKAQYEQELGKVSGGKQKAIPAKQESKPSKADDSQLMKNAILEDSTDEIQETSQLIEEKSSDETESGRFIEKAPLDKKEMSRDSKIPTAPAYFESAGNNEAQKREPKEPQMPPKSKRSKVSFKNQIAQASKSKAILFNEMTDAPEPIPVEAMISPLSHNN